MRRVGNYNLVFPLLSGDGVFFIRFHPDITLRRDFFFPEGCFRFQIIHQETAGGRLNAGDQIVFVGVSSQHREAAFDACRFLMDYLKTEAPFWKKEITPEGDIWVETFDQALYGLYKEGEISYEDAIAHADSPNDLRLMIKLGNDQDIRDLDGVTRSLRLQD